MSAVAEKLLAIAAEIEEHPERWCQHLWGKGANGKIADTDKAGPAVSWCAFGFCCREADAANDPKLKDRMKSALEAARPAYISWNDEPGRKPAEVAALFRKAAALAEAES